MSTDEKTEKGIRILHTSSLDSCSSSKVIERKRPCSAVEETDEMPKAKMYKLEEDSNAASSDQRSLVELYAKSSLS